MEMKWIKANARALRGHKGLTQKEVAEKAGISVQTYRKIESGTTVPRVDTLDAVAKGLGTSLLKLIAPASTPGAVRFRAKKKLRSREMILADVGRWLDDYELLESVLNDRIPTEWVSKFNEGPHELDFVGDRCVMAAEYARDEMDLESDEPITDICGLLERNGVKVWSLPIDSQDFFGLSIGIEDGGPAVVVNTHHRLSVERWIFSAAHELGHVLLHPDSFDVDNPTWNVGEENEANCFASFFLMPDEAFSIAWREARGLGLVFSVLKVKSLFRVSYRTVLRRLQDKGLADEMIWKDFSVAYKKTTGRSLKGHFEPEAASVDEYSTAASNEPERLSSNVFLASRLHNLVRKGIEQGMITISRGAEILRMPVDKMYEYSSQWIDRQKE